MTNNSTNNNLINKKGGNLTAMTKTFYRTGTYEVDHSTFGGLIYSSDFNTGNRCKNNYNGSPIAKRIASDDKFDQQCRKNKMYTQN